METSQCIRIKEDVPITIVLTLLKFIVKKTINLILFMK